MIFKKKNIHSQNCFVLHTPTHNDFEDSHVQAHRHDHALQRSKPVDAYGTSGSNAAEARQCGREGKRGKGWEKANSVRRKRTKCDCSSIVPLLVSRQNTAFRVATVLPCRSKGGAGCICGAQRISRRLGAEVQRCFHGHTTPPR